ncbi:MAG: SpoIIE family protein phosphatase [Candidatus Eisenbacteria bacterium]
MFHAPLFLLSVAFLIIWIKQSRGTSPMRFIALWWVGLLLARIAPVLLSPVLVKVLGSQSRLAGVTIAITYWLGALLLLRAIMTLALWKRPMRKRTYFALGLVLLAVVITAGKLEAGLPLMFTLSIPWLASSRWRDGLGARDLSIASFTGFASFVLSIVNLSAGGGLHTIPREGAHASLTVISVGAGAVYGVITVFAAATRIHLSIRHVGRRLVVSHILSGFVPTLVAVLFLLLAGNLYLSSYRGQLAGRYLNDLSDQGRARLSASLAQTGHPPARPFPVDSEQQTVLAMPENAPVETLGQPTEFPPEALFARSEVTPDTPLLWDRHTLFVRARLDTLRDARPIRYEALAPIDSIDVARIARIVGTAVQLHPRMTVTRKGGGVSIGSDEEPDSVVAARDRLDSLAVQRALASGNTAAVVDSAWLASKIEKRRLLQAAKVLASRADSLDDVDSAPEAMVERLTAQAESLSAAAEEAGRPGEEDTRPLGASITGRGKLPGGAVVRCLRWRGVTFAAGEVPILTNADFAEIIAALFQVARENPVATVAVILLVMLAIMLIGAIGVTVSMVSGMVRSVTRAVQVLKEATTAIGEGKLDHRIAVEGQDELWSVASSFNEMAAGLERVRSMELENQRLEQELNLAREIQNRLLPSAAPNVPEFEIAGVSMPAREVGGDYFDYLVLEGGLVGIAVADVSGKGAAAALLMSSFRASLRSYDLANLGPAETLARLNRFVHGSVTPGKFITAFLGVLDPRSGDLRYSCAGHEPPVVVAPDGSVEMLDAGGLVLGLFPNAAYEEATARLPKGSLLAVFTDGVTEAQSPEGEFYGDTRLLDALKRDRGVAPQPLLDKFVKALKDFAGGAAQFDDITMVLARRL